MDRVEIPEALVEALRRRLPWLCPAPALRLPRLNVTAQSFDRAGRLLGLSRSHNAVPLGGRNIVRELLGRGAAGAAGGYAPTHVALGTGTTAPSDGDTALESEVFRGLIDVRQGFDSRLDLQLYLGFDDANGNTLTEVGLLDSPAAGTLLARALLGTPITKDDSTQAVITWSLTIASGP